MSGGIRSARALQPCNSSQLGKRLGGANRTDDGAGKNLEHPLDVWCCAKVARLFAHDRCEFRKQAQGHFERPRGSGEGEAGRLEGLGEPVG